jgi:TRAP-type C4-dicarboxylate transport system permease small subunit
MKESSRRSREILVYTCSLVICILFLLFIFLFVSYRCGQVILEGSGTTGCVVGNVWFAVAAGFVIIALFSLYRVNRLMRRGS